MAAVAAAIVMTASAGWLVAPGRPLQAEPSSLRVEDDEFVAFDASGVELWRYRLPYAVHEPGGDPRRTSLIEDLDGDGRREVVTVASADSLETSEVICLEPDGALRWRRRADRRARFGSDLVGGPWVAWHIAATDAPGSGPMLWAAWISRASFASFVERIDVRTGAPSAVYWSAGRVTAMGAGEANGRQAVFIGAASSEHKAASLAVYALDVSDGAAPTVEPAYACRDCPSGRPLAFFVFPRTNLSRAMLRETGTTDVVQVAQDQGGALMVAVRHNPPDPDGAVVFYRFDEGLRLKSVEPSPRYRALHAMLEQQGALSNPLSAEEERQMMHVLSWDGSKFVRAGSRSE